MDVIMAVDELLNEYDPSYFDTVMIYLLNVRDDLPLKTVKERLTIEGRKQVMSIAENKKWGHGRMNERSKNKSS